jgi:hypothetical protein
MDAAEAPIACKNLSCSRDCRTVACTANCNAPCFTNPCRRPKYRSATWTFQAGRHPPCVHVTVSERKT